MPVNPLTADGARTFAPLVPLPTWPTELLPQHCTVPAVINAQAWFAPVTTLLMAPTTEVVLGAEAVGGVRLPLPN